MRSNVGIRDVARAAGVSVGTVSNVLNYPDQVSTPTLAKVQATIKELGFVRNGLARQLRMGRGTAIGLVVVNVANPFFAGLAHELEAAAETAGHTVVIGSSDQNPAREQRYIDLFDEQRVRGLLIVPQHGMTPRLARLRANGTPVVLFDSNVDSREVCSVGLDGDAGGYLAVRHLIETGRRRLVIAGGPLAQIGDRVAGASRAARDNHDVTLSIMETSDLTVEEGRNVAERILALPEQDRPDAVFATNDLLAIGLLQTLNVDGRLSVPDDIAIVGYDDIDFAASTIVPLTTIRQPRASLARAALDLLEEEIDGDEAHQHGRHLLQPELIIRDSTT
ncbi:LacI family transcriptional regulator (plasmid) [Frondihabitans sp. PAMC 28766]|uniref:LacI family DNA-binding transcriptional regulator n=1 Tax=Frondihabitans sp. PAMC 28766 TaxID=1795630 RepID=UPI00078EF1B8|nr:LacI family DNA-binding transcriptional regulator [Frondihabitans sp. PAMC 28766]AMM22865.1 LacI family transcriptional regulator [Frondihabitans sp. PAMC 28766]